MYDRILTEARTSVWLIRADKLDAIFSMLEARAAGIHADAVSLEAFAADSRKRREAYVGRAVGVLPVYGSIVQRGNMFTEASGTASADVLSRQMDQLLNNEEVGTILADFDTPGGTVYGVPELAAKWQGLRGRKPMVASINAEACSAGYWLASAFDEIVITPSGSTGSIGAYARHDDVSEMNAKIGVKPRYISYGDYKTEGNPDEPLSDEAAAEIQKRVNLYGRQFEEAIAANRGVPVATVRSDWGRGRVLDAETAKVVGMVDRIESFEQTLQRLASDRPRIKRRLAHARRMMELS